MSFLRLTVAGAAALPPEIGFLLAEGVDPRRLARAAELARASGTDAATALLAHGLMAEDDYYRALARALGAPYRAAEAIRFGQGLRYPDSLAAGLAPLALGEGAPCVLAPRGPAIAELLAGRSRAGMPAITAPGALRAAVYAAIPEAVADHVSRAGSSGTPRQARIRAAQAGKSFILRGACRAPAASAGGARRAGWNGTDRPPAVLN